MTKYERLYTADEVDGMIARAKAEAAQPEQEPVAWPCEIEGADFEQDTVTLKMLTSEYVVRAGKHWLSTTPPAQPAQRQPLTPAYIREGIAAHIEDVFSLEKVWTVREAADYIRSIEIHGIKEKNT
jgi:hypothetical protein